MHTAKLCPGVYIFSKKTPAPYKKYFSPEVMYDFAGFLGFYSQNYGKQIIFWAN